MTTRFDELKIKGWVNLSKDEKEEYQSLKPATQEATIVSEEENVTLSKSELRRMMESVAEDKISTLKMENAELKQHSLSLEKQVGLGDWQDVDVNKKRSHTAQFKLWRKDTDQVWGLIVDWKHLRFDYDENSRKYDKDIYKVTLMDDQGNKSEVEMTIKELGEINEKETVQIIDMQKKVQVMSMGKVRRSPKTRDGYTLSPGVNLEGLIRPDGGEWVDQSVTRDLITCTVKRKNGQVFEINANRLNS